MIFYSTEENVYQAAKRRIKWIFGEAERLGLPVVVSFSGGKDSTATLFMTKEVMDELGIPKVYVFWLDEEVESPFVVEYNRRIKALPWIDFLWVQSEYPKYNTHAGRWEKAWPREGGWIREKEPDSYKDFVMKLEDQVAMGVEYDFFMNKILGPHMTICGLHIDESPMRRMRLMNVIHPCPGNPEQNGNFIYYPLFDWRTYDIWYFIFENKIDYCKQYNYMFSRKPLLRCRVGSFWNEQCHEDLINMKEVAPEFYDACCKRMKGVGTTYQSHKFLLQFAKELPSYFNSWDEYFRYLVEHIVQPEHKQEMIDKYEEVVTSLKKICEGDKEMEQMVDETIGKASVKCAIKQDHGQNVLNHVRITTRMKIMKHNERKETD